MNKKTTIISGKKYYARGSPTNKTIATREAKRYKRLQPGGKARVISIGNNRYQLYVKAN